MLVEILELDVEPELRPASLDGYECKLWGQYPALLAAESGVVDGAVYSVKTAGDAQRLADYETRHYQPVPCVIRYLDGMLPSQEEGYVFMFGGDPRELHEGRFDLKVWLKRIGRSTALEKLEAKKVGPRSGREESSVVEEIILGI